MNDKTYSRRSAQLLQQIQLHPHKEELLNLMYQQVQDELDTPTTLSKSYKL